MWIRSSAQRALQTLCGFLQLAFEGVDLLRYRVELLLGKRPGSCNFLDFLVCLAYCSSDSYRNSREPVFLAIWLSSMENQVILRWL